MSPWRLERLRVWRTRRLIALAGLFLLTGLGSPILTYYLPELLKNANTGGVTIIVRKQTAADGMLSFAGNIDQLGTLTAIVVAAATLCFDANPVLAAFYRTRRSVAQLLAARYLTLLGATLATLVLGTLGAWYETAVLLGPLNAGDMLGGFALEALWFALVVSVVAAAASLIRGVPGTVGASVGALLAIAAVPALKSWLPTRLADGVAMLVTHQHDTWRPALAAGLATVALLALAVNRFAAREVG
jgi:ABC-2 type transport system permease protein